MALWGADRCWRLLPLALRSPSPASASLPAGARSQSRVSEKRRARRRCRVSGRKRLAGDSRRDGDLSTVKYREEKWAEALIFDVRLVPSTFKGVEKEEPFLRMDPDYLRPEAADFVQYAHTSCACHWQRDTARALHSARRYLCLGAGEITTTPSASFQNLPSPAQLHAAAPALVLAGR